MPSTLFILSLALLPFLAKGMVLYAGLSGYALQSLYKVIQLLIPTLWRRFVDAKKGVSIFWPTEISFPPARTIMIATGIGIILSCCAIAGLYILMPYIELDPSVIRSGFDERFTVTPIGAIGVAIFLATVNAALEELHFRWWLNEELLQHMRPVYGFVISSALFAGMHILIFAGLDAIPPLLFGLATVGLFIAGMLWSIVTRLPGGIHGAWWSHCVNNIILMGWGLFWLGYV